VHVLSLCLTQFVNTCKGASCTWFYCKLLSLYIGVQSVSYAPKESYYAQIYSHLFGYHCAPNYASIIHQGLSYQVRLLLLLTASWEWGQGKLYSSFDHVFHWVLDYLFPTRMCNAVIIDRAAKYHSRCTYIKHGIVWIITVIMQTIQTSTVNENTCWESTYKAHISKHSVTYFHNSYTEQHNHKGNKCRKVHLTSQSAKLGGTPWCGKMSLNLCLKSA